MSDPIILIFIAVASVCFGFLVGYVVNGLIRQQASPGESAETQQAEVPAQKKAPDKSWNEVANLWRDSRNGQLIFQIDDDYYKRGSELTPKEREILLKVVMDYYQWLEPPSPVAPKPQEPVSAAQAIDSVPLTTSNWADNNGVKPVSMNPVNLLSKALEANVSLSASPAQNMVSQVDAILQEKLHDADMQKWAVRLTEFPNRGMVVLVGLEQYEGIDEVPYERVRQIIRASVAEWERRAEAGELV